MAREYWSNASFGRRAWEGSAVLSWEEMFCCVTGGRRKFVDFVPFFFSTNGYLLVWVGGLDSYNPLVKGIVTWAYPDSNPKPPGPKPTNQNQLIF